MNAITATFSIRRATTDLLNRLTRKASLELAVTVNLPPFVKFAIGLQGGPRQAREPDPETGQRRTAPLLTTPGLTARCYMSAWGHETSWWLRWRDGTLRATATSEGASWMNSPQ